MISLGICFFHTSGREKNGKAFSFFILGKDVAKGNSISGFVHVSVVRRSGVYSCVFSCATLQEAFPSVRRWVTRFSKNTNSKKFKGIKVNSTKFNKIHDISQLLASWPCFIISIILFSLLSLLQLKMAFQ